MSALDADQQQEDVRVAARVPVQTRRAPEAEPAARPGRLQVERVAAVEPKAEAAAPFAATAAGVEAQIGVQVEGGEAAGGSWPKAPSATRSSMVGQQKGASPKRWSRTPAPTVKKLWRQGSA